MDKTFVVNWKGNGPLSSVLRLHQLHPRLFQEPLQDNFTAGLGREHGPPGLQCLIPECVEDRRHMGSDFDPVLEPFSRRQLIVNLADQPRLKEGDDDARIVPRSKWVAVANHAPKNVPSVFSLAAHEHFLRRHQTLVDEDAKDLLPESLLLLVVALKLPHGVLDSLDEEVVAVRLTFRIKEVLFLADDGEEVALSLLVLELLDALFEGSSVGVGRSGRGLLSWHGGGGDGRRRPRR